MITSALWVLPATGAIARFIPLPVAERSRRLAGGRAKEPQIGASYVALACVSSGTQIRSYGAACCNVMLAVEGVANGEDKTILVGGGHPLGRGRPAVGSRGGGRGRLSRVER
jgi:hypothetical protein